MIHFIYGEDTYRSFEALKKLEDNFIKKFGDLNIDHLGSDLDFALFDSKIRTLPFLGNKRLVVVKNLLQEGDKEAKKQIESILKKIPETTEIIFFEQGMPDRRESIFKLLDKLPLRQIFNPLESYDLKKWADSQFEAEKINISPATLLRLIDFVGPDLFRLQNEIKILSNFARSQDRTEVTLSDVEKIVEPNNNHKIFDLTDAIAARNSKKALQVLFAFKKWGEDEFKILGLIIHQIRTMLILSDLGRNSADQIAKETSIHPFVVRKTIPLLKNFSFSKLRSMYGKLAETDWKIKNGEIEMGAALELLIVDFCER